MPSNASERSSHLKRDGSSVPLETHLKDVQKRVRIVIPDDAETLDGRPLVELVVTCARVHDLGKLTSWFQQHLQDKRPEGPKHHSLLGAFAAYYALGKRDFSNRDQLVGFVAVARHHGVLPDAVEFVYDRANPDAMDVGGPSLEDLNGQIRNIDANVPEYADRIFRNATDGDGNWTEFVSRFDDELVEAIRESITDGQFALSADPEALDPRFYDLVLQVWSSLCLADKTSAASLTGTLDIPQEAYRPKPPVRSQLHDRLERIRSDAPDTKINQLRDDARKDVLHRIEGFLDDPRDIATITLPTGLGKTITGLDAAMKLREETGGDGRIVYALPYTSIIDQVAGNCRSIFETNGRDRRMSVDHHLAETKTSIEGATDDGAEVEVMLGESWRAGLIITTFVQLFESLAGPSNSQSMKLPALYDAVVILDEPQSLPEQWWALARRLAALLTEQYDATVIAMTATQPRIFDGGGDTQSFALVESPERYFGEMDRVCFSIDGSALSYRDADPTPVSYPNAAQELDEALDDGSVLAICNTIDSAIALSEELSSLRTNVCFGNEVYDRHLSHYEGPTSELDADEVAEWLREVRNPDQAVLLHLSTRHRPVDRRLLLDATQQLLDENVPIAIVSTQLVEAGVDVSFDHVFRDFAPLDSIVQAAGRCNRSNRGEQGVVTVWLLDTPEKTTYLPSKAVYGRDGNSLPKLTMRAISDVADATNENSTHKIDEQTLTWDGVNRYYDLVAERSPGNREWIEYVNRCEAEKVGGLSLIEQRQAADIVVPRTAAELRLVGRVDEAFEVGDFDTVDDLLGRLRDLQVSVPIYDDAGPEARRVNELDPMYPNADLRRVDGTKRSDSWFSAKWGLTVPEDSVEGRFL